MTTDKTPRLGAASLLVSISDADGFRVSHGTDKSTLIHVPAEQVADGDWGRMFEALRAVGARK